MIKLNGKILETGRFPNGETYVKPELESVIETGEAWIDLHFECNDDLINLLMLRHHLYKKAPGTDAYLTIMYMPYSRMDRQIDPFAFSLEYIAMFINSMVFTHALVLEPHSDVTMDLLTRATYELTTIKVVEHTMKDIGFDKEKDYILYPDMGAQKRYKNQFNGFKSLVGNKERDLQTGEIISFEVDGDEDLNGANVIICDDLCSRGGTFLATASVLQDRNVGDIYLAVTHLENTVNAGGLPSSDLVKGVYATDSIYTDEQFDKLKIVEVS